MFEQSKDNTPPPKIMVVDDDRLMRTIMVSLLRAEGYSQIEHAQDGHEALQKFPLQNPSIVFLDIEMPGFDGIETLRAIMEHGTNAQVVMVSGLATPSRVEAAKCGGAAGFLVKPVTQKRLADTIDACLKRANRVAGEIEMFIFS